MKIYIYFKAGPPIQNTKIFPVKELIRTSLVINEPELKNLPNKVATLGGPASGRLMQVGRSLGVRQGIIF